MVVLKDSNMFSYIKIILIAISETQLYAQSHASLFSLYDKISVKYWVISNTQMSCLLLAFLGYLLDVSIILSDRLDDFSFDVVYLCLLYSFY